MSSGRRDILKTSPTEVHLAWLGGGVIGSESDQKEQAGGGPGTRAGQPRLEPDVENGLSGLANINIEE